MGVGKPLRGSRPHSRNDGRECAEGAAADHQPPVTESILDSLHDPAELFDFLGCDARAQYGKLDRFWNRIESNRNGNQSDAVPEKQLIEGVAPNASEWIYAEGCEHQDNTL